MLIYNEGTVIKQCVLRQDLGFLVSLEVQTTLGKDESKDFKKDESEDFKKDESKDFKSDELEIQTMLLDLLRFEIQQ